MLTLRTPTRHFGEDLVEDEGERTEKQSNEQEVHCSFSFRDCV